MNKFFPVFINLTHRKCLVAGGGKVAERKVKELLRHGADVTVVSPQLTAALEELRKKNKFTYLPSRFSEADLEGVFLLIDATGSQEVNKKNSLIAKEKNILVNIVNAPEISGFFTPAILTRGDLKIAVSTSGNSPALAAKIKKELSLRYGPEYGVFLRLLGCFRKKIMEGFENRAKRKKVFNSIVESDIIDLIIEGRKREAVTRCEDIIDSFAVKKVCSKKQNIL